MKAESKQKEFFVSHLGQHMGPWTLEEIAHRMSQLQLIATDFLYDDVALDWIELNKHEGLLELISKEFRPKTAPSKASVQKPQAKANEAEVPVAQMVESRSEENPSVQESWYVQKESHRFGPLSSIGVVKALQEKSVYDFEFIWKEGMSEWIRIAGVQSR